MHFGHIKNSENAFGGCKCHFIAYQIDACSIFKLLKKKVDSASGCSQCIIRAVARRGLGVAQHPYSDFSAPVLREALSTPMQAAPAQHPSWLRNYKVAGLIS